MAQAAQNNYGHETFAGSPEFLLPDYMRSVWPYQYDANQGGWQKFGDPVQYEDGTIQNYVQLNSPYSKNATQFQAVFTGSSGTVKFPGVTINTGWTRAGTAITWPFGHIVADQLMSLAFLEHEYGHYLDEQAKGEVYYMFGIMLFSGLDMVVGSDHNSFWTEVEANQMAVKYFGPNSAIAQDPGTFPTTLK
jgi:hypothetical protein